VDHLVCLVGDQDPGRDHREVLRPAAAHRKANPFGAFQQCVNDGADGKQCGVAEVADVDDQLQQQLDDHTVAGLEVELVLRVVGPAGQQTSIPCHQEADGQGNEDDRLDDPLDDDDFDEGVMFATHAAELRPQPRRVVRAL